MLKKSSEAHGIALNAQSNESRPSVIGIKKKIVGDDKMDFFEVSKVHLLSLEKRKKIGQLRTEVGRLKIFQGFLGIKKMEFIDLDITLPKKIKVHLIHEREVSSRTAINYLILIRTIYSLGIKEYGVDSKNHPYIVNRLILNDLQFTNCKLGFILIKK